MQIDNTKTTNVNTNNGAPPTILIPMHCVCDMIRNDSTDFRKMIRTSNRVIRIHLGREQNDSNDDSNKLH